MKLLVILFLISIGINLLTLVRLEMTKDDTRYILAGITTIMQMLTMILHKEKIISDEDFEKLEKAKEEFITRN